MVVGKSPDRSLNPVYWSNIWQDDQRPVINPDTDPDRPPFRCFKVNKYWLQYMFPPLSVLALEDTYAGTYAEQAINAKRGQTLLALLANSINCEGDMDFRQPGGNPCVIEYSNDGGLSWQTMFDFGECPLFQPVTSIADLQLVIEIVNDINIQIGVLNDTYDGTPGSIAPDMDFGGSGSDDDRNTAICGAIYIWIRLLAEAGKVKAEEKQDFIDRLLDDVTDLMRDIGTVLLVAVGAGWLSEVWQSVGVGFLLGAAGLIIQEYVTGPDIEAFNDQAAISEVACCLYSNLADANVTEAAFQAGLTPECAWSGSNAERIAGLVEAVLQDRDTYLQFLDAWQQSYGLTAGGAALPCDCADWTSVLDFGTDDYGFAVHPDNAGSWVSTIGFEVTGASASDPGIAVFLDLPSQIEVTTVKVNYQTQCGSTSSVTRPVGFNLEGPQGLLAAGENRDCPTEDGTFSISTGQNWNVTYMILYALVGAQGTGAYARIQSMEISGRGTKPAWLP